MYGALPPAAVREALYATPTVPLALEPVGKVRVKAAVLLVTVRDTVAVWVIPPPVPVTVIVYDPAAAVEATAIVIVEVPEPGEAIDVGLKETVTPVG